MLHYEQKQMIMKEKRTSNKLKQKQLQTKSLEQQTKKMEDKLSELKRQIQEQKKMRTEMNLESTVTRWQKTTKAPNGPLKSYAKQILEEQKQAYNQFGLNQKKVLGSKTFESVLKQIKVQKDQEEDRNPTKITTFLKQPESQEPVQKNILENNFFKAKMDVKSLIKQKTLQDFLQQNYILEYLPRFKEEGIEDLEALRYINRERLQELGVKAGHQIKIIKKIKEEFDKMLAGKVEEPKIEKVSEKVQSGYGEGNVNAYESEEAVPQASQISNLALNSKINPPEEQSYEQEQQDVVLITAPMHSIELQVQQAEKFNCYQCYKVVLNPEWRYDQKCFCSEFCFQKFMSELRKTCPACGKIFLKTEGYREQGLWFCSLGCCPNQQQIEQMFLLWHRRGQ